MHNCEHILATAYYLLSSLNAPCTRIQGDMNGWMDFTDPMDNTLKFNASGLAAMMSAKAGAIWGGYLATWDKLAFGIEVGQRYLMENTTLGIPAIFQSEGKSLFLSIIRMMIC